PRTGEDDFRGVGNKPRALQIDPLVQRKDQRRPEAKKADRSIEHGECQRHVENRKPEQQKIDRSEKKAGVFAEHQQQVKQIEEEAEGGNEIEEKEVESVSGKRSNRWKRPSSPYIMKRTRRASRSQRARWRRRLTPFAGPAVSAQASGTNRST